MFVHGPNLRHPESAFSGTKNKLIWLHLWCIRRKGHFLSVLTLSLTIRTSLVTLRKEVLIFLIIQKLAWGEAFFHYIMVRQLVCFVNIGRRNWKISVGGKEILATIIIIACTVTSTLKNQQTIWTNRWVFTKFGFLRANLLRCQ